MVIHVGDLGNKRRKGGEGQKDEEYHSSQLYEVLLVVEVEVLILTDEFLDLVRVHIIAVNRVSIFVTGDVLHLIVILGGGFAGILA